jgi:prepilin-type N-terminal cleavage/methylation domain-containing protein
MMKAGFTLIELMVSLVIASMLGISLTLFLSQTGLYQAAVENRANIYTRASVALHQLEKDINGARVPIENILHEQASKAKEKNPLAKQPAPTPQEQGQPKEQKEKSEETVVKPFSHVFYAEQKDKQLVLFSCITSNPLKIYWSHSLGAAKPNIARVVYRLVPDPKQADTYMLMRQEGIDLDFANYDSKHAKSARSYEVIDGVKSVSMRFVLVQPQEKDAEKEKNKTAAHKITEYYTWNWPAAESEKKESATEEKSALPSLVSVTLSLWDMSHERSTEFVYTIPIFATSVLDEPGFSDTKETPTKETTPQKPNATSPAAPGATPNAVPNATLNITPNAAPNTPANTRPPA